ncbi:MAG: hypothetical protein RLN99_05095 [Kiloniellaceae bacterium]
MRILAAAAFWAAFFMPAAAVAFTLQCVPREPIFDSLRENQGEVPAFRAPTASGQLFEVLVSPDGGWTAFITFPDGLTCPIAMGEGWRPVPAAAAAEDPAA